MFILDSLMISGIRWALETALTAAEAEMNDDSVLREQLLEAEMRRETGEISDEEFRGIETDLLARIRTIKERREGGAGPIAFGAGSMASAEGQTFQIEASVSGDFHDPAAAPHTTVLAPLDEHHAIANLVGTTGGETIAMLDMAPGDAAPPVTAPDLLAGHGPGDTGRSRARRPGRKGAPRSATRTAAVASATGVRSVRRGSGGAKRTQTIPRTRSRQKTS